MVETSVGLLGFSGVVFAIGRSSESPWSLAESTRLINLLAWSMIALVSALFSLNLISAEVEPRMIWRISSAGWLILGPPFSTWVTVRTLRRVSLPPITLLYVVTSVLAVLVVAGFQIANLIYWGAFWPHFAGISTALTIAAIQFIRLIWYRLIGRPGYPAGTRVREQ